MKKISWEQLNTQIYSCNQCPLATASNKKVPGEGLSPSPLMLIGEAPGKQEDQAGYPFIGPAGQLLTKMLNSIDIDRKKVYTTNILKCRPPNNRSPSPNEIDSCLDFLRMQVALVKPKVLLLLGAIASQTLLGDDFRITKDHGRWYNLKGLHVISTFHPSALLRDENKKPLAWSDLKSLRKYLVSNYYLATIKVD